MQLRHAVVASPVGPLTLVVDEAGALAGLYFLPGHTPSPRPAALGAEAAADDPALAAAAGAVLAYLEGRAEGVALPLSAAAGTPFQLAVWEQIAAVPRGAVVTYGEIAAAVGRPTAVRAVGQAVGRNPLSLAVPCHRVVGCGGRVTGYAGGVERKRWLLALESGQPLPELTPARGQEPVRAVLFDRDGTLVHDVPYNGDPALVRLLPGAAEAVARVRAAGLATGLVTNQSGVARGIVTREQADAVTAEVVRRVGGLDVVLTCPHGPDDGCACRKPAPGMVRAAAALLGVPVGQVLVVGDAGTDVGAALAAGARAVLVPTAATGPEAVSSAQQHAAVAPDLGAAVDLALSLALDG